MLILINYCWSLISSSGSSFSAARKKTDSDRLNRNDDECSQRLSLLTPWYTATSTATVISRAAERTCVLVWPALLSTRTDICKLVFIKMSQVRAILTCSCQITQRWRSLSNKISALWNLLINVNSWKKTELDRVESSLSLVSRTGGVWASKF